MRTPLVLSYRGTTTTTTKTSNSSDYIFRGKIKKLVRISKDSSGFRGISLQPSKHPLVKQSSKCPLVKQTPSSQANGP